MTRVLGGAKKASVSSAGKAAGLKYVALSINRHSTAIVYRSALSLYEGFCGESVEGDTADTFRAYCVHRVEATAGGKPMSYRWFYRWLDLYSFVDCPIAFGTYAHAMKAGRHEPRAEGKGGKTIRGEPTTKVS